MSAFQRMINDNAKPKKDQEEGGQAADAPAGPQEPRARYKSYRKKFRKMRITFDAKMDEANELFIAEHKANDIARRLQEQNDQLMEMLLEINQSKTTKPSVRYDIGSPSLRVTIAELTPVSSVDTSEPRVALKDLETKTSYSTEQNTELRLIPGDIQGHISAKPGDPSTAAGYMTMEHLDEYLNQQDRLLDGKSPQAKPFPTERDFANQSTVSVRYWMHTYQPGVFESNAGKDKESEKGGSGKSPPPRARAKGKEKATPIQKEQSEDPWDEESGYDPRFKDDVKDTPTGSARGKKKKDDEAYRPKGGRSTKRKREKDDTPVEAKGTKKPRKSADKAEAEAA